MRIKKKADSGNGELITQVLRKLSHTYFIYNTWFVRRTVIRYLQKRRKNVFRQKRSSTCRAIRNNTIRSQSKRSGCGFYSDPAKLLHCYRQTHIPLPTTDEFIVGGSIEYDYQNHYTILLVCCIAKGHKKWRWARICSREVRTYIAIYFVCIFSVFLVAIEITMKNISFSS